MRYIAYGLAIFAAMLTVAFATGYLPRDVGVKRTSKFKSVTSAFDRCC
jgi:hypothetical protein